MTALPAPTPAAGSIAERVEAMIALTERLTERIAMDAASFEARRPHEAAERLEETSRLANIYRHESARMRAHTGILSQASLDQRTRLVRATEAFDAVLARQGRALEAAKTVTDGLVRAIANEVANQRGAQNGSYGAGGTMRQPAATSTAITLNARA